MKKIVFILLVSAWVLLCGGGLNAATVTSIADGNWSSTSTWDCACVPAGNDQVTIAHDVTLDVDILITAGFSLTINSGESLIGNTSTRRIGFTLSNAGPAITITNNGTFTIGIINRENSGGDSNDDYVFDNYGTFNILDNADCNGSSSSFSLGRGTFRIIPRAL